jgi:hypothetical protein
MLGFRNLKVRLLKIPKRKNKKQKTQVVRLGRQDAWVRVQTHPPLAIPPMGPWWLLVQTILISLMFSSLTNVIKLNFRVPKELHLCCQRERPRRIFGDLDKTKQTQPEIRNGNFLLTCPLSHWLQERAWLNFPETQHNAFAESHTLHQEDQAYQDPYPNEELVEGLPHDRTGADSRCFRTSQGLSGVCLWQGCLGALPALFLGGTGQVPLTLGRLD